MLAVDSVAACVGRVGGSMLLFELWFRGCGLRTPDFNACVIQTFMQIFAVWGPGVICASLIQRPLGADRLDVPAPASGL
jgi:hypothetical protein